MGNIWSFQLNSNSDVDNYPSGIYNVNYIATQSDKERKSSSFRSPSIGLKNEISNRDFGKHSLEADPMQLGSLKLWLQGKLRLTAP